MIEFPPYRLDREAGRLWRGARVVPLRPKAWAVLCYLAERPGALIAKDELHAAVWGETVVSDDALTQTLGELRRALRDDPRAPRFIETVHRRGVRFVARLQGARREDAGPPSRGGSGPIAALLPPPAILVGRDGELTTLRELLRQASAGQRQVVFVQGEPGIGKTSVVAGFLDALATAADGALVGYGQCVAQYGEREPYMPVLEALERLCRGSGGESFQAMLREVAPSWLAQVPSLRRGAGAPGPPGLVDLAPHRMLREFASLVEVASAERPLVLVLEDLHWSDHATVELVSVLAQRPERARMLLVGTYRPAQVAGLDHPLGQAIATLRARRRCMELALEYLGRRHVALYLQQRFPASGVPEALAPLIHAQTDGNPLFMVMLVDHLVARGSIVPAGDTWRLTADQATIERDVPDELRVLIEAQLGWLSPAERDALEVASVAGVAFDAAVVAAGLGDALDATEALCEGLCRPARWLRHREGREWPDGTLAGRYAFAHGLYQRLLYGRLSPARRASLHRRIGERLEAGYAGRTAEVAAELAVHFQHGRDPRRAVTYLEQAAWRGYERHTPRDVAASLEPALELLRGLPDTPERAWDELRLRRLYGAVVSQTRGYAATEVVENLTRARSLGERLADPGARFDALYALAFLHANRGECAEAERIGRELAELSAALDPLAVLKGHFVLGVVTLWSGRPDAAGPWLARVLSSPSSPAETDPGYGVNPLISARSHDGLRRWLVGESTDSMHQATLALADRLGRPFAVAHAATFAALLLLLEGQWAEAGKAASRAIDVSEEHGFPLWLGISLVSRGRALVEQGDGDRGLREIREGLDVQRRIGQRLAQSLLLALSAEAGLRLNRVEEGLAATEAGLAHCRDTTERLFEAQLWRLRGQLLLRRGRARTQARPPVAGDARDCFERARAVAHAQGARRLERLASRDGAAAPPG